ncbi:YqjF family protein [Hydrotalea sp.]|uniref:YqjF family protein n=1 Tax=Hydrotalea sp. TaxID=2881279 RepID=UPI003D0CC015
MKNDSTVFLTANWRYLIFSNYTVAPHILQPYLPEGIELDLWNGSAYVSLVGFYFTDTRLKGIAIPFHQHFEEFNLRFYVKWKQGEEWKRGVVFIKEIVPKPMISYVARWFYGEHYYCLPMQHAIIKNENNLFVQYQFKVGQQWNYIKVESNTDLSYIPAPDSEAFFITEHYYGFTRQFNHRTSYYRVEHPSWRIFPVYNYQVYCNFSALYDKAFEPFLQVPQSVFLAEGSSVKVYQKQILHV